MVLCLTVFLCVFLPSKLMAGIRSGYKEPRQKNLPTGERYIREGNACLCYCGRRIRVVLVVRSYANLPACAAAAASAAVCFSSRSLDFLYVGADVVCCCVMQWHMEYRDLVVGEKL